ncbi:glycosyltransferase WbuB [Mycobacteriaceae bacterium 1482268.1]|nr:glycosyltransferase WbuB [Mycobacteriaceae bacterium 1482268.1]
MRVLVLGLNYAPESTGIAPYTTALAEGLATRGHQVRVLTGLPHYPQWKVAPGYEAGLTEIDSPGRPHVDHLLHHVPSPPGLPGRIRMELSFGSRLCRTPWGAPDVVLCVSPALLATAMAIARARSIRYRPMVGLWVQDLYGLGVAETGAARGIAATLLRALESKVLRAADGVVVIHDRFKDHMVRDLGVQANSITVIRNWTHLQPAVCADRAEARRKRGWPDDVTVALHAGNMGAKQGLDNVIQAAKMAESLDAPVRFVLLGDGNQRAKLEQLAAGVTTLELIDPLPDAEYQAALAAADVLLVNEKASVAEMAVPSKITSYFTTGNPVIAATSANSITASEITRSGGGLVIAPENPSELLAAVQRLRTDRLLARRLGNAGMTFRTEILSEQQAIDSFEKWLTDLAARLHHGRRTDEGTQRQCENVL